MKSYTVTNIIQSKRLVDAGLNLSTADLYLNVRVVKDYGAIEVYEDPYFIARIEERNYITDHDNRYYAAAWSLGKLIQMMPDTIPSACDEDGNKMPNDSTLFKLTIDRTSIKYVEDGGKCLLRANGSCLLEAAVRMVELLINNFFFSYLEDESED